MLVGTFLLTVLNKMGFGHKWINWISWCISSPKFFVIVNDTPLRFFKVLEDAYIEAKGLAHIILICASNRGS